MSRIQVTALAILVVVAGAGVTWAAEYPTLYRGNRPLGMGGAFLAVPDDSDAIFYNPASLVAAPGVFRLRAPLIAEVSQNTVDLVKDALDLDEGADPADIEDVLDNHLGERQRVRASFAPTASFHLANVNVGLGILYQQRLDLGVDGALVPVLESEFIRDIGVLASAGIPLFDDRLDVGATLKFVKREASIQRKNSFQISAEGYDPRADSESKSDFAFDLGFNYHLVKDIPIIASLDPLVALVFQNITELELVDEPFDEGRTLPFQINVGASVNPSIGVVKTVLAVQLDDLGRKLGPSEEDDNTLKRFHLGAEVEFPILLALRVGLNQGYFAAGATLDFWLLELSYTTYAEEIGFDDNRDDDRRHIVEIALAF